MQSVVSGAVVPALLVELVVLVALAALAAEGA